MPSNEDLQKFAEINDLMRKKSDAQTQEAPFDEACKALRSSIKETAAFVLRLKDHTAAQLSAKGCYGEMQENVMLSYRHLEDAAMRLGKAIQAFDGGVSVYDK